MTLTDAIDIIQSNCLNTYLQNSVYLHWNETVQIYKEHNDMQFNMEMKGPGDKEPRAWYKAMMTT